jgi:hypothetical protein
MGTANQGASSPPAESRSIELGFSYESAIDGECSVRCRTAKRALEHVIQSGLRVVFRLCKTATKPAEFSGPNTTNSLYCIIFVLQTIYY